MPLLEPRVLRTLRRVPKLGRPLREYVKADPDYACWFWALAGFRAAGIDPKWLFDYLVLLEGYDLNDRREMVHVRTEPVTYAQLLGLPNMDAAVLNRHQNKLNNLRDEWRRDFNNRAHTRAKTAAIKRMSHEIVGIGAEINGLVLSDVKTPYEVCCHFPADIAFVGGDVDNNGMAPNYDHWWLRIDGHITIETFPRLPGAREGEYRITNLRFYRDWEQDHEGKAVSRHYVRELHQEHVNQIVAAITNWNGELAPFTAAAYPGRQDWQRDDQSNACFWCFKPFGRAWPRRHHCRRCGVLFCDNCSSQRDAVAHPANERNQNLPAANNQRVCVTCYTQNN